MKYVMGMMTTGIDNYKVDGYVKSYLMGLINLDGSGYCEYYEFSNMMNKLIDEAKRTTVKIYIYDLDFYGKFIMNELSNMNLEWSASTSGNTIFQIKVLAKERKGRSPRRYINFYDAKKIYPAKIEDLAKSYEVDVIDVEERYVDEVRKEDVEAMKSKMELIRRAMIDINRLGLDGITIGSSTFREFKKTVKNYKYKFPKVGPKEYEYASRAFQGGYNYLNPKYKGKELDDVIKFDMNSMHPYIMMSKDLPIGRGVMYKGKYEYDELYPLYIQKIHVGGFVLKPGRMPMVNDPRGIGIDNEERYMSESIEPIELVMTNVELEIFIDNYYIMDIKYIDGFKYRSSNVEFEQYMEYWGKVKEDADREGNKGMRALSKFAMNYIFGKMGQKKEMVQSEYDNNMKREDEIKEVEVNYTPVAAFVSSYSIKEMMSVIKEAGDDFIYSDVDSIHIIGCDVPEYMKNKIDESEIGMWKIEGIYNRNRYVKLKTYININNDETVIKAAGAPEEVRRQFDFNNFKEGNEFGGRLIPRDVNGGRIYVETDFKI